MRGQSRPSVVQRVYCRVPRHLTQALPRQHSTLAGEESSLAPISLRIFRLGHRGIAVVLIIGFLLVTFMVPSTPRIGMGTHRRAPAQLSHLSLKLLLLLWRIATTGCTTTRIFYITTAVQPLEHLDLQLRRTDLVQRILLNVTQCRSHEGSPLEGHPLGHVKSPNLHVRYRIDRLDGPLPAAGRGQYRCRSTGRRRRRPGHCNCISALLAARQAQH